jgi:hypothetical protein
VQLPAALSKSPKEGAARYSIQIDSATPISFKVKAVPVEADKCGTFLLKETGLRELADAAAGMTLEQCWR